MKTSWKLASLIESLHCLKPSQHYIAIPPSNEKTVDKCVAPAHAPERKLFLSSYFFLPLSDALQMLAMQNVISYQVYQKNQYQAQHHVPQNFHMISIGQLRSSNSSIFYLIWVINGKYIQKPLHEVKLGIHTLHYHVLSVVNDVMILPVGGSLSVSLWTRFAVFAISGLK